MGFIGQDRSGIMVIALKKNGPRYSARRCGLSLRKVALFLILKILLVKNTWGWDV